MISDPSLVIYACVSKGTTILAEYTTGDPDLDAVALKCLENAPQFHSVSSHTARRRTYTFLFDDPLICFGIFDENLLKSQELWFLDRIKDASKEILKNESIKYSSDTLTSYCFQGQLNLVFRNLLSPSDVHQRVMNKNSMNASKGQKKVLSLPLLGKPVKGLKKKKRSIGDNNNAENKDIVTENKVVCVSDDGGGGSGILTRDFSVSSQKNGLFAAADGGGRQKAKQKWRQHVWVVLMVDLVVCCVLFGIWLGICRGFKCIDG